MGPFRALFMVGALWVFLLRVGMVRGKNRYSGYAMVTMLALLLLSGHGFYCAGEEMQGHLSVQLHLFTGALLPRLFGLPLVAVRRGRQRRR